MPTDIKLQIVFAVILTLELLGLFMIIIRTVANLEHALNRVEEIIKREVQLSIKHKENERLVQEKANKSDMNKGKKNELLLNIPFMDRLNKDKHKENG
jgi:predicted Holliday junction resolvase-like endonuclease